jgi:hypothetical protein
MRIGCFGCLGVVLLLLVVVALALGGVFMSTNLFAAPTIRAVPYTRNDGYSAQQKLFELVQRQAGRSARRDPVVFTEAEANAFLSRHLDQAGLPLSPIVVRFTKGELQVQGQTQARNLLKGPPFAQLLPYVKTSKLDEPVWVTVRGTVSIDGTGNSRTGHLSITDFALGKQPLGPFLLSILLGPSGGGLLQWPVPAAVDAVKIGDGQLFVVTR